MREQLFHYYIKELANPLAELFVNQIKHNMLDHSPHNFQELLEEFETGNEVSSIHVLNDSGKVVFSNNPEEVNKIVHILPDQIEKLTSNDFFEYTVQDSRYMLRVYSVVRNLQRCHKCHGPEKSNIGYLAISINNITERRFEKMLTIYDFGSFLIILFIFTIIIITIHHLFFQIPFRQIKKGIKLIEHGNLNARLDVKTPGELKQMAESINGMVKKLRNTRKKLDELHRKEIDRAGQLASVGELAASVAHEIKNPISGIRNALDIILDQYSNMKEEAVFQEMLAQIERVNKTIQDLMNFARPREPKFAYLDIHTIIKQVVNFYREQFHQNGITLEEKYEAKYSTIEGDGELLKQVFVNILMNAYQACLNSAGKIKVRTRCNDKKSKIIISIRDNGRGIPLDKLNKIFKPFYTTKHKGTGLGLSLSQSIILKHSGKILASSVPGEWTEFSIELPIVKNILP
jgi:signal transduction histidine kinase